MIHRTPFFLPWLYPTLTWRIQDARRQLFLTFDDGPVPGPTEFVLQTLALSNSKATFFCIGDNIRKHPDVFRSVLNDGHEVGNHTFHHVNGWRSSRDHYIAEVGQCEEIMQAHNASTRRLFRPPYGRITHAQVERLKPFDVIMWDVLTMDYRKTLRPERCLRNSISAVRDGSIIVFHDSIKAEKNLYYVLPRFIDHFASAGYSFNLLPAR